MYNQTLRYISPTVDTAFEMLLTSRRAAVYWCIGWVGGGDTYRLPTPAVTYQRMNRERHERSREEVYG